MLAETLCEKNLDENDFYAVPYIDGTGVAYALFRAAKYLKYEHLSNDEVNKKAEYYIRHHLDLKVNLSFG